MLLAVVRSSIASIYFIAVEKNCGVFELARVGPRFQTVSSISAYWTIFKSEVARFYIGV